jgi:hypothetical protein
MLQFAVSYVVILSILPIIYHDEGKSRNRFLFIIEVTK